MPTINTPGEANQPQYSVVVAVIRHVAKHTGRDVLELPPLYEAVDPAGLDALVASAQRNNTPLSIQFTYAGHEVTIDQDSTISCMERQ